MGAKKHGGARPNAGRKKGLASLAADAMREAVAAEVTRRLPALLDIAMKRALKGDMNAWDKLFDRAYGRAPNSVDITSNGKEINHYTEEQIAEMHRLYMETNGRSLRKT